MYRCYSEDALKEREPVVSMKARTDTINLLTSSCAQNAKHANFKA